MSDREEEENVQARHRKEKKELQAKITALKKTSGKKNKKELQSQIEQLEKDLETRHLEELKNLTLNEPALPSDPVPVIAPATAPSSGSEGEPHKRKSKAQKRREKKSEKERERQKEIELEAEEHKFGPRNMESKKINEILQKRQLMIYPIAADGDCLYNSVAHQLRQTGRTTLSVEELRQIVADYIRDNKDDLLPYMVDPDTGDCLDDEAFETYCNRIISTKCWGGQIEIQALSNALKVPIEVLQATGQPIIQTSEGYSTPNLVLTFHRHFVSLGEHYNSTQPLALNEEE